jgi:hypothetical protein
MSEIRLYVEFQPGEEEEQQVEALVGADGLVVDPMVVDPQMAADLPAPVRALRTADAEAFPAWREQEGLTWATDGGLECAARLLDAWPELNWVPHLMVFKPQVRYRMSESSPGEGFKVYMPDTAAIRGYQVMGSEATLSESLARAAALGFQTLWLHALNAEEKGSGLDLELLERAARQFRSQVWLSGGAASERHLANLAAQEGAAAVVVPTALAKRCTCERLRSALATPPTAGIPLRFVSNPACAAKKQG